MITRIVTLCLFMVVTVSQAWLNKFFPVDQLILLLFGTAALVEVTKILYRRITKEKSHEAVSRKRDPMFHFALVFFCLIFVITYGNEIWNTAFVKLIFLSLFVMMSFAVGTDVEHNLLKRSVIVGFSGLMILSVFTNQLGFTLSNRGVFNHPNLAAMISAIVIFGSPLIPNRAFRVISIICAISVGVASNSMSWFLACGILLPIKLFTLLPVRGTRFAAKLAPLLAITLSITPMMIVASPDLFSYVRENAQEASTLSRLSVWKSAFDAFVSSPIVGKGPDGIFRNYIESFSIEEQLLYAHNFWLTFLGMGGLIVTIPLTLFFIRIIFFRQDSDLTAPFVVSSIIVFSSVEYALQLDSTTWIVLLIFSIRNVALDPTKERAGLQPSSFVGGDKPIPLANRSLEHWPKQI